MKELLRDKRFFVPAIIFSLSGMFMTSLNARSSILSLLIHLFILLCILATIMFDILKNRKKAICFASIAFLFKSFSDLMYLCYYYGFSYNYDRIILSLTNYVPLFINYIPLVALFIFSIRRNTSSSVRKLYIFFSFSCSIVPLLCSIVYYYHYLNSESICFLVIWGIMICCIYGCIYYYEKTFFRHAYHTEDVLHIQAYSSYLEQYKQKLKKGGR